MENELLRGVYTAERASSLAGVPKRTVYFWARHDILTPNVSAERIMLWSWSDLVALRAIYWLRHPIDPEDRSATSMRRVKGMIKAIETTSSRMGDALSKGEVTIYVDRAGKTYTHSGEGSELVTPTDRLRLLGREMLDPLEQFFVDSFVSGPDLRRPRATLRIVPGKLAGEPHVEDTRIETRVLDALSSKGYGDRQILEMYPDLSATSLTDAIDLEQQLKRNLLKVA
ncbi:MAG: DUF433 domain-containing protein [Dehalococcoidia bacterium]